MTAPEGSPSPGGWRLTWEELERHTGWSSDRLYRLVELSVLKPAQEGLPFSSADILRVGAMDALETSGVELEDVAEAISRGELSLAYLDYVAQPPPVVVSTQAEVCEELGLPFEALSRVYLAFGLPQPRPDERVREDDARIQAGIKLLMDAVGETDVLSAARLWGESLRRIAEYQVHLFHSRIEQRFRAAGVPEPEILDVALREVGVHTSPYGERFAEWLYRRHTETFTVEHRVLHAEEDLERAGIRRRASGDPPAIAFIDISGYTRLTEELGDEFAALAPMRLAAIVEGAATRHAGRTVKWIGDGVELYFRRPLDAVRCSLDLREHVPGAGLPKAHVGINAGPVIYENGDFYGRTVNLAARVAAHADAGQVLVTESTVSHAADSSVRFERLGPIRFKGVSVDVVVFEAGWA